MKSHHAYTVLMALFIGTAAFLLTRAAHLERSSQAFVKKVSSLEQDTRANLAWMRKELSLTDEEFARECQLHEAHLVEYRRLCAEMNAARERLKQALENGNELTEEGQAAIRDYEVHFEASERAAIKHVKKVAASLSPEAGRVYLKLLLPRLFPEHDLALQSTTAATTQPRP